MRGRRSRLLALASVLLACPAIAWSQAGGTGAITGVVRDTSGAVLPGVTVEAASPALIEKARTAVTDGQGIYRIVDLRPGIYAVTFTLPGFSTVRRDGLELTTGFTATVNAELRVGTLEETITVSGQSPVVDIQNTRQQQTLARTTLDAIPFGRRLGNYAALLPGAVGDATRQDVGGTTGEGGAGFAIHGSRVADVNLNQDGMDITVFAASVNYSYNPHNNQEVVLETGGISAESYTGGIQVNIVPKDGGNIFSGGASVSFTHPNLQSDNLADRLRDRGLTATPSLKTSYDVGGSLGGPLRQDKLWFFTAHRKWVASRYLPGNFFNRLQGIKVGSDPIYKVQLYEPDPSRPAFTRDNYHDGSLRLTWQASLKDKIAVSYTVQNNCNCPIDNLATGAVSPEAGGNHYYQPNWYATAGWSRPATNRLLFEAAISGTVANLNAKRHEDIEPNDISILELSINRRYGSRAGNPNNAGSYSTTSARTQFQERVAVSYITGSHNFKTGANLGRHITDHHSYNNIDQIHGARSYSFRNGIPVSVTIFATPFGRASVTTRLGAFVQDQWTIRRLTLNLGARYETFNGSVPTQHFGAGYFVPERDLPAVEDSPDWRNLNPRLGGVYDLFGNGRTAVKASLGRYVIGTTGNNNTALGLPIDNQATSATRTWNDLDRDYVPDCVLGRDVLGANGECGALSDVAFGLLREGNTRLADEVLRGFNDSQPYNWQSSVSVQQELWSGTALNVAYFRTSYGNFTATDNLAVNPADYDQFCITAPVDSRLPGGGGQQMCGLYDLAPAKFGQVANLIAPSSRYGKQREIYNGVDATLNMRFGGGGLLQGGLSVGRTTLDNCAIVDSPQQAREGFCKVTPPWSAGTQVKFLAVYPLPWNLQTSAVYQNVPGIPITASHVVTNAQIAPSLGRNLGACRGAATCNATATIELVPPETVYEDRRQQLDVRFTRAFDVGGTRVRGNFEVYNVLNASPILALNTRYGPQWLNAVQILAGRLFRFGVQVDF